MKKSLLCALAAGGFAAAAQAADLDGIKDPLPDTITWNGVTIYGTIDVGYGYETHGLASNGSLYTSQGYNIYGESKATTGSNSALTNNALSQSTIGVKIEENLGMGFVGIGHLDTGLNPITGEIADACKSLIALGNEISSKTTQTAFGDGSRCGQAINGEAYAGLSNAAYGTLTIGRQNSLELSAMTTYDPMGGSYAMSALGWSGFFGAGAGSTETSRWDNSAKYAYQYGPVHAAVMYSDGGQDTAMHDSSVAGDIGFTYHGLSVDGVYMNERGAINAQLGTLVGFNGVTALDVNQLYYFVTNNQEFAIQGKYTFDFGGGFKDEGPTSKLTVYAGYVHTDQTGAGPALGAADGTTIGGYVLAFNNVNLLSTRTLETAWVGAKYEAGPWSFTGAYYWLGQNSFSEANFFTGSTGGCAKNPFACAGDSNTASFLVDYTFNKHFDVYAGVSWSDVTGGLAHSSFSNDTYGVTDNTTFVSGMRLKF